MRSWLKRNHMTIAVIMGIVLFLLTAKSVYEERGYMAAGGELLVIHLVLIIGYILKPFKQDYERFMTILTNAEDENEE